MMIKRYSRALSKRARGCRADRVTRNRVFEGNVFEDKKKPACVIQTDLAGEMRS